MLTTALDVAGLGCVIAAFTVAFGVVGLLLALGAALLLVSWRLSTGSGGL